MGEYRPKQRANSMLQSCTGYSLITNAQWQTIARNIEQVSANWSGGSVGAGSLNRGHSDSAPNNALAASTDDDPCYDTG